MKNHPSRELRRGKLKDCGRVRRHVISGRVISESSLYPSIRDFLEAQGYVVRAEAHHCDVVARKESELVVVELKRALTLELLAQGIERLKLTDSVYVAIPHPETFVRLKRTRELLPVVRRLELGLLFVDVRTGHVSVQLQPLPAQRRRQPKATRALLVELNGRTGDDNIGGTRGRKLVTAYRENSILVAVVLRRFGSMRPRDLRKLGTGEKTLSILSANFYGWFSRVDRGIYGLTPKGLKELEEWKSVVERKEAWLTESHPEACAA